MYLLDTDICSYVIKRTHPELIQQVMRFAPLQLKVSAVTVFELEYGVQRSRNPRLGRIIQAFLQNVETLSFNSNAARESGAVRAELAAQGMIIGAYDLLIAGHARSVDAILVTNNEREFSRVSQLEVENWASSSG